MMMNVIAFVLKFLVASVRVFTNITYVRRCSTGSSVGITHRFTESNKINTIRCESKLSVLNLRRNYTRCTYNTIYTNVRIYHTRPSCKLRIYPSCASIIIGVIKIRPILSPSIRILRLRLMSTVNDAHNYS
jgi:hypothetical protein